MTIEELKHLKESEDKIDLKEDISLLANYSTGKLVLVHNDILANDNR